MNWVRLKDIGDIITGTTPSKKVAEYYNSNDIPFVKPDMFNKESIVDISSATEYISSSGAIKSRKVKKDTVLVTCIGNIGNIGITKRDVCFNQQINAIVPNESKCNFKFLAYAILFRKENLKAIANAPVVPIINKTEFSKFKIPLPPLETQHRIVAILDKAQSLIDKRKEQLALMDELTQSVFYDMFGDPVRNEKGWEQTTFSSHIGFITSGSRGWAKYYSESGNIFIRINNVKRGKLDFTSIQYVNPPSTKESIRTKVQKDDLLISITADLGRTAVVDSETADIGAYINQHLCLVRLKELSNPLYISYFLESSGGKRQINKKDQVGVKSGLNFDAIKSLKILTPPINLQNQFTNKVNVIEEQKDRMQESLEKLVEQFAGLMQRAFSGEIV